MKKIEVSGWNLPVDRKIETRIQEPSANQTVRERERGFTFNKPWEQRVKEAEIQLEKKRGWDGEKERESENRERERERKRREEASSFRVRGVWGKERKRHDLGLLGLACQNDLVLGWAKRSKTPCNFVLHTKKLLSDGLVKYSILLRNGLSTLSKVQTNP